MKKLFFISFIFITVLQAQPETSKISGLPGSFSRMGFGARGMGMANVMSGILEGNLSAYYNPALSAFQEKNSFHTSYSFLSLDRSLNFLNFTKSFHFGEKDENGFQRGAGISVGIINSGVSGIEHRNSSGVKLDEVSTSENQFFFGLSNRFSRKLAIGVNFKFYYYSLWEEVSSTGLGFDIGALYSVDKNFNISLVISDINTKYKWDTSEVYGSEGRNSTEKFPLVKKLGLSYTSDDKKINAAAEFESSNAETNFLRVGAEYNIFQTLFIRGGVDRMSLGETEFPVRPSLGFSYIFQRSSFDLSVDYAFVVEPYSSHDQHIVGINFLF